MLLSPLFTLTFFFFFFLSFSSAVAASKVETCSNILTQRHRSDRILITEFGGVGDGKTLNTKAFRKAIYRIQHLRRRGGTLLYLPRGVYLTESFNLTNHMTLYLAADAVIKATQFQYKFHSASLLLLLHRTATAASHHCRCPLPCTVVALEELVQWSCHFSFIYNIVVLSFCGPKARLLNRMDKGETLKRKRVLTLSQKETVKEKGKKKEKGNSPVKKMAFDFQVRSSAELLQQYQIKREKIIAENIKGGLQDQAPKTHQKKHHMTTMVDAVEGQSQIPMMKKMTQPIPSSQRQEQRTLPKTQIVTQGEVDNRTNGKTMDQPKTFTQEEENPKEFNIKPTIKAMSLDHFFVKEGIDVEEDEYDDLDDDHVEEIGDGIDDANNLDHEDGDSGTTKKKKTRGKTTCKKIHATSVEDREEIIFDKGQAVGPTTLKVSHFSHFLGTVARNPTFATLLYTSWRGVPTANKEEMWRYVNSKYIIPASGKHWVMKGICDAWKRYKKNIKEQHFDKYDSKKDMLKNRPQDIPEVQFRKLIQYWSLPYVQAMCRKNSENRKKQQFPHRMGPINFGIVRTELRATKENNEDPTRAEMFIATRTSRKGKEVDANTQIMISKLQNRKDVGENDEDAFVAMFGNDQPGRVRCYGRAITASSLKKDEEICRIKQQHDEKVTSLENKVDGLCNLVTLLVQQVNPGMSMEDVAALLQTGRNSPPDANSGPAIGRNVPRSSGSNHVPNNENDNLDDALDGNGVC